MNKKAFITFATLMLCALVALADDLSTGEWAFLSEVAGGGPAIIGQPTADHLFVRNTYTDMGIEYLYDNVISFKGGTPQKVWFWLDDNEVYTNPLILDGLTPTSVDRNGEFMYNEITYSCLECILYLPEGFELTYGVNRLNSNAKFDWGDRMPFASTLSWKKLDVKVIDGITYTPYKILINNNNGYGNHFSANDEFAYEENGALGKDDAALFALFIKNNNQDEAQKRMPDLIIANLEFGLFETLFTDWGPNWCRYFYGQGGNNETQRFQYYHRVVIYGSGGIDEGQATAISLNQSSATMNEGETLQLTATVFPVNATNKTVTWKSSNSIIATVNNNGLVMAKTPGVATITATTTDGSNLSASCTVTVVAGQGDYDNYLSMNDITVFHGDTIVIPISLTNEDAIVSFQTDIVLPEGLEIIKEDGEYLIDPSDRMTRTHSLMSNDVSNGAVRVLCYSSNYKPLTGTSGDDLFYITVKVADNAEGDYTIQLRNTLFTNSDFEEITAPDVSATVNVKAYLLGDANGSGSVTITDVVVTSRYILEMNPEPFVFDAADVTSDGNITVTDVTRIAWMVLNPTLNVPRRVPAQLNNGDRMSADDITLVPGETRTVSIALNNSVDYSAFQFDLMLPEGLSASDFRVTDRAGGHSFDVNELSSGKTRVLCYSPALTAIVGTEGSLLTFDVRADGFVDGTIQVDGIELVTTDCQAVNLDGFAIGVNSTTAVNELTGSRTVYRVDYYNLAGQRIARPESGVTLKVITYTDGTRITAKVIK